MTNFNLKKYSSDDEYNNNSVLNSIPGTDYNKNSRFDRMMHNAEKVLSVVLDAFMWLLDTLFSFIFPVEETPDEGSVYHLCRFETERFQTWSNNGDIYIDKDAKKLLQDEYYIKKVKKEVEKSFLDVRDIEDKPLTYKLIEVESPPAWKPVLSYRYENGKKVYFKKGNLGNETIVKDKNEIKAVENDPAMMLFAAKTKKA